MITFITEMDWTPFKPQMTLHLWLDTQLKYYTMALQIVISWDMVKSVIVVSSMLYS